MLAHYFALFNFAPLGLRYYLNAKTA